MTTGTKPTHLLTISFYRSHQVPDDIGKLQELLNHDLVLDATIMGGGEDYTVVLALANRGSLFGQGSTLHAALKDAFAKFEREINLHRN